MSGASVYGGVSGASVSSVRGVSGACASGVHGGVPVSVV